MAEDAYLRLAEFDPTAEAALSPDPETCPTDLTDSIARLVERRAGAGQSIGQLVTFAYRLPRPRGQAAIRRRSEEHTSELQSRGHLVCRLLLEKQKRQTLQE